tara:strand:- start:2440 stop:2718 length:279 start_codon:yes stop_codon:yes gene_type:complete
MEYLSLLLVLSHFIIHNIFLVIIGIILALYLINEKNRILNKTVTQSKKEISNSTRNKEKVINEEYSDFILVDKIEELGYIPSRMDLDSDKAA